MPLDNKTIIVDNKTIIESAPTLYVVSADTHKGGWGANIYIFAICDTMERALEEQKKVKGYSAINEIKLNEFKPIYLGGYVE